MLFRSGCNVGDKVTIVESKPISRQKRWVVQSIVRRIGEPADAGKIVEGE